MSRRSFSRRIVSHPVFVALGAVVLLALLAPAAEAFPLSSAGGRCGGFAGLRCQPGLACQMPPRSRGADLMGVCVPAGGPGPGPSGGLQPSPVGGRCGGIAGLRCQPGLTCRMPGMRGADLAGVCTAPGGPGTGPGPGPQACTRIYRPVCGRDGRTYGNDCEMRRNGVPMLHPGRC